MRLVIEKHGKGYTVTELPPHSSMMANILCAATNLSEALDFVSKRMEPQSAMLAGGVPVGDISIDECLALVRGDGVASFGARMKPRVVEPSGAEDDGA